MTQAVTDNTRQSVLDDLNRIHNAVALAPQAHSVARHRAFVSAINTAIGSVTLGLGWKALSEFSDYHSRHELRDAGNGMNYQRLENDFAMIGVKRDGYKVGAAIAVNMRNFIPRMLEGLGHASANLQSLDFWKRSFHELKGVHSANPKKTYIIGGIVAGLSTIAGVHRYFRERTRLQNENAREISDAVHSIARTVQENPAIIEDPAVAALLKERLANASHVSTATGWTDNMKAVRRALEEQAIANSR